MTSYLLIQLTKNSTKFSFSLGLIDACIEVFEIVLTALLTPKCNSGCESQITLSKTKVKLGLSIPNCPQSQSITSIYA